MRHTMPRREFFSYHGTIFVGRIVLDEKTGIAKGFNAKGRLLGEFVGYDAGRKAVSDAFRATAERKATQAKATANALEYLNRPNVELSSGMPAHFLAAGKRR
jgi:hypothetical protein